ncbi:hypothetical protein PGTUg99_031707 [Puccinia graminis f. sp. tritici]|uniref:Uncharacterized protein n=1 Tax=Puccinia graminis f. sp. tritici TaxID=56615 RepID=A0A5B0LY93_PUCGR|nr:hypothetical protein PGTUg99_031707 [Puccinia graminis f. sp. tritici]
MQTPAKFNQLPLASTATETKTQPGAQKMDSDPASTLQVLQIKGEAKTQVKHRPELKRPA